MPALTPTCVTAALELADQERVPCMGRSKSSDIDRFVGHRIKELRLRAGMTQQQLAKHLGVSNQQVHKMEKAIDRVSAGQLLAIARAFDVEVADLFDGCASDAPLNPLVRRETSQMLLAATHAFLKLGPKRRGRSFVWPGHWRRTDHFPDSEGGRRERWGCHTNPTSAS